MSSPQLIVIYANGLGGNSSYSYGELTNTCFIDRTTDRDIRIDDCVKVDPSPAWNTYMQRILKHIMIRQSDGQYKSIKGRVQFLNMIKIRNTGYLMPEIQVVEPQDTHYSLQWMSDKPRQPTQCIAPPKPVVDPFVYMPPVPTVKRVRMAFPSTPVSSPTQTAPTSSVCVTGGAKIRPNLNPIPVPAKSRGRSDSCDSTRAVRLQDTRGRSDSCDSTAAVRE